MASQTISPAVKSIFRDSDPLGIRPDPLLTVSEWADQFRVLSTRASAEPGPWRTSRAPYLKEIMDCLSPSSSYKSIVLMAGAQIGKTECGNNWIGYIIHKAPGPMMAIQPTVEMAKRNSKQRIDPLIEEVGVLRNLVRSPRSRDSGNTVLSKEFPGGVLVMTGANSAVGLRSMAARYLFLDEVDAYPADVDGEGDPVSLLEARSRTFSRSKKFMTSTPGITGLSRIEAAFEDSDQRRYWVPCPHCNEFLAFEFAQLEWPKGEPEKVWYNCPHCKGHIGNHHKQGMLALGEWRTANPSSKVAGFHLSSLYSPVGWFSWADAAEMWEKAQKDQSLLKVYVNTVLGETWKDKGEAPDWQRLYDLSRGEVCRRGSVPERGLFLTAGVDVQQDRIEVQVVAWGRGKENWLVDHVVLNGRPTLPNVWDELTDLLNSTWRHPSGLDLGIMRMGVDSSYETQSVYSWVRRQGPGRALALDPRKHGTAAVGQASPVDVNYGGKKIRRGCKVWPVATSMLKSEFYGWLKLDRPTEKSGEPYPPGYCHFPPEMDDEFFKQLTAEQLMTTIVKGYRNTGWEKMRERNEALDCRIYARAAAAQFGIDRFSEAKWKEFESQCSVVAAASVEKVAKPQPEQPRQPFRPAPLHPKTTWIGNRGNDWFRR